MRRAMTSPKRVLLFSIAVLAALALGAPSGALAETGLDASSPAVQPDGVLVAQTSGAQAGRIPGGSTGSEEPRPTGDVNIPNLVGRPLRDAGQALLRAGLDPVIGRPVITSNSGLNGKVESQSPRANRTVPVGTRVTMNVYRFIPPKVPNVVGMLKVEADRTLRDAGFGSSVRSLVETGDLSKNDRVKLHQPPPGMPATKGTTVALDVYKFKITKGPKTTTTAPIGPPPGSGTPKILGPDFWNNIVGMRKSAAENKLRKAGYTPYVANWRPVGNDVRKRDRVTKIDWYGRGKRVRLDVYKYDKDARVVPDVTRMKLGDAKKKLKKAGFKLGGSEWVFVRDQSKHCKVQSTYPSAGTSYKKGEEVSISTWTTDQKWTKDPGGGGVPGFAPLAPHGYLMGSAVTGKFCHF